MAGRGKATHGKSHLTLVHDSCYGMKVSEREKEMFIGSTYKLRDRKAPTSLGFTLIHIKDRVLSRTETRQRGSNPLISVTSYHYTLMCLVDVHDSAENQRRRSCQ